MRLKICPYKHLKFKFKKKKDDKKREQNIQKLWDNFKRYNVCTIGIEEQGGGSGGGEENGAEKYLNNNNNKFSKINDRYQITDP